MSISAYSGATNITGSGSGPGLFTEIYYADDSSKVEKIYEDATVGWTFSFGTKSWVVVDDKRESYVSDDGDTIRKLNINGVEQWQNTLSDKPKEKIEEGGDFVYLGIGKTFRQLDKQTGTEQFSIRTPNDNGVSTISADEDGNVYVGPNNNEVFKYDNTGSLVWTFTNMNDNSIGMEYSQGNIYVATEVGNLRKVDASTGNQVWSISSISNFRNLAIDFRENLHFITQSTIQKYDSSGNFLWKQSKIGGNSLDNGRDIDITKEGEVIIAAKQNVVARYDKSGNYIETIKTVNNKINRMRIH